MNLKSISKSIVSNFSRNIKCIWSDWQNLRVSVSEGTYISRYWDKFYKKRYNVYSKLDTDRLLYLLSHKSVEYNAGLSYSWIEILLAGVLGALLSNIDKIVKFLTSDNLSSYDVAILTPLVIFLISLDFAVPLLGWLSLTYLGLGTNKAWCFYVLFFVMMIFLAIYNFLINVIWTIPLIIIILSALNIYGVIVTVLDCFKQRIAFEYIVIKDILLERGVSYNK
ncbi:hypothetical protein HMPREF1867_01701 [Veillonella dispar]|jgi:hypothetical protein|nr:hypothetical protein HMPREF1867_01701 [Veillonella dispar]